MIPYICQTIAEDASLPVSKSPPHAYKLHRPKKKQKRKPISPRAQKISRNNYVKERKEDKLRIMAPFRPFCRQIIKVNITDPQIDTKRHARIEYHSTKTPISANAQPSFFVRQISDSCTPPTQVFSILSYTHLSPHTSSRHQ
jgi:hypothetical protein